MTSLASPLDKAVNFSADLVAREQTMKMSQFLVKHLSWRLAQAGNKGRADEMKKNAAIISSARKVVRFAKFLDCIKAFRTAKHPDPLYLRLLLLIQFTNTFYFVTDGLGLAGVFGLLKGTNISGEHMDKLSSKAWFCMGSLGVIVQGYQLAQGVPKTLDEKFKCVRAMVRSGCDALMAGELIGLWEELFGVSLNDGVTGAAGVVSGGIGMIEAFERVNPEKK